jgi:hypothetical protein
VDAFKKVRESLAGRRPKLAEYVVLVEDQMRADETTRYRADGSAMRVSPSTISRFLRELPSLD